MNSIPDSESPATAAGPSEGDRVMRHTPGPWDLVQIDEDAANFEIQMGTALGSPSRYEVQHCITWECDLYADDDPAQYEEACANARLIAAAPALLAAVQAGAAADAHRADPYECPNCDDVWAICPDLAVLVERWRTLTAEALAAAGVGGGGSL